MLSFFTNPDTDDQDDHIEYGYVIINQGKMPTRSEYPSSRNVSDALCLVKDIPFKMTTAKKGITSVGQKSATIIRDGRASYFALHRKTDNALVYIGTIGVNPSLDAPLNPMGVPGYDMYVPSVDLKEGVKFLLNTITIEEA